jgi:hypothetical protein
MDEMDGSGKNREGMNRRDFAGMVAGMLAVAGGFSAQAEGQAAGTAGAMRELASGVFKPIAGRGMQGGHESHSFMTGMLKAGNIRLEMHESVEHRMEAGDVGLCCAGDEHWIANAGETELAYFVVTVGPPE